MEDTYIPLHRLDFSMHFNPSETLMSRLSEPAESGEAEKRNEANAFCRSRNGAMRIPSNGSNFRRNFSRVAGAHRQQIGKCSSDLRFPRLGGTPPKIPDGFP
ncbi:hypothetical protein V1477_011215 [Vespula maculifrons]|uniref:Uncharacterized protein n=2 Tax=Vespula TaxID=7451 RepID=A0A834KE14_VESVU|nr:hypothetical protein HZH66_003949 [Vespula vulgaris]